MKGYHVEMKKSAKASPENFASDIVPAKKQTPDSCYVLEFTDGTTIYAYDVKETRKEISYRFCDSKDHSIHIARRERVISVTPPNAPKVINPDVYPQVVPVPDTSIVEIKSALSIPDTSLKKTQHNNCDLIIYKDGREESAIVTEVGLSEIKFKRCSMPGGPDFSSYRNDVYMLKFSNGRTEVIKTEYVPDTERAENEKPKNTVERRDTLAVMSLTFGALGVIPLTFLGSVLAIIFGAIYLRDNKADPERYPSKKLARAGMVTGIVVLSLLVLIILLAAL